jgi:hypothetical protein
MIALQDFLAKGGQFGSSCLQETTPKKLCSLDTTLSLQKIEEIKRQFVNEHSAAHNKVIYMTFHN